MADYSNFCGPQHQTHSCIGCSHKRKKEEQKTFEDEMTEHICTYLNALRAARMIPSRGHGWPWFDVRHNPRTTINRPAQGSIPRRLRLAYAVPAADFQDHRKLFHRPRSTRTTERAENTRNIEFTSFEKNTTSGVVPDRIFGVHVSPNISNFQIQIWQWFP